MNLDNETKMYMLIKAIKALMFCENFEAEFETIGCTISLNNYNAIIALEKLALNYRYILDDNMKENIYKMINYYRHDVEYDDKEMHQNACEMLNTITINLPKERNNREIAKFVNEEVRIRGIKFFSKINYLLSSLQEKEFEFSKIKKYNIADYYVICLISNMFEDEGTEQLIKSFSDYSTPFIYSINTIIEEWPSLIVGPDNIRIIKKVSDRLKNDIDSIDKNEFKDKELLQKEYKVYTKKINKLIGKKEFI